jgi:hypothetical protein
MSKLLAGWHVRAKDFREKTDLRDDPRNISLPSCEQSPACPFVFFKLNGVHHAGGLKHVAKPMLIPKIATRPTAASFLDGIFFYSARAA